ncbi:MAG: uroporphyrinogen decarboxylase [Cytophagales bacterium]|nr:uroporphyrinogen decarboxylase [Cytophagales bacterium]MDW8383659.1 uroporphyrinogen decarboxylase [Flammeovirgaceae bacterium]
MPLQNDLILRAARGEEVSRVPVWLMRQAGRVLPEYRITRLKAPDFISFVKNPELAAEVTVQPVEILGVDAAIIFSDILVVPEALGLPYEMYETKGPYFPKTISCESDIKKLRNASCVEELYYVEEAIRLTKQALHNRVPLIGFAGAPFTIFCYMIEGSSSKTFSKAKKMLYQAPLLSHLLLQKITDCTISYLQMQIRAGANIIQLFDSWAGILTSEQYRTFAIPYIRQILEAISEVPKIVFAKDAFFALADLAKLPCDVIGLDWCTTPEFGRKEVGSQKTLQGNLDPCALYAPDEILIELTQEMLRRFGKNRYIANLGHGLYPDIEKEKAKLFVKTVQEFTFSA